MESVAVLSDIHGVLPALDAVLAEPPVRAADRIAVTGDIAAGPQPGEVLDRLIGLGERVTWVRGNADQALVELARRWTGWRRCHCPCCLTSPGSGRCCSATPPRATTPRSWWWTRGSRGGRRCSTGCRRRC